MTPTDFLARLDGVTRNGTTVSARCPAHSDRIQSLSVSTGRNGQLLVHCHAGCDVRDVLKALDLTWEDVFDNTDESPLASYEYRDLEGRLVYVVDRYIGKRFRQRRPTSDGWEWNLDGVPRLLYRLPQLVDAISNQRWIFIVEGEKDVHTLESLGFVATCVSGGSSGWRSEFSSYFQDAKVCIIPDWDEPGRKMANQIAGDVEEVTRDLRVLYLDNIYINNNISIPPKGDISIYYNIYISLDNNNLDIIYNNISLDTNFPFQRHLRELVHLTPGYSSLPTTTLSAIQSVPVSWVWEDRVPHGKLSILAGLQGGGKSYLAMWLASEMSKAGQESLYITFEDDPADTLRHRAELLGADLDRIHVWDARHIPFLTSSSVPDLMRVLRKFPGIELIIVDPIVSALGETDTYRDADVRRGLEPLVALGKTVVGIAHLRKESAEAPAHRILGSNAFTSLARQVLLVESSGVVVIKSNVGSLGHRVDFRITNSGIVVQSGLSPLPSGNGLFPVVGPGRCQTTTPRLSLADNPTSAGSLQVSEPPL